MTKVAITGGGGFIGQQVVKKWLNKGFEVYGLAFSEKEKQLMEEMGAQVLQGDVRDMEVLNTFVQDAEYVIHIAAKVGPFGTSYDFMDVNVRGSHNLLKTCKEMKVKCVILFLTGGLLGYAGRDGIPASEQNLGYALPEDPYILSKEMVREIADIYNQDDMRVICLMPTCVYGPGPLVSSNGFTKIIYDYAFRSWRLIMGSGKQIRNFVYVGDVAEATYLACKSEGLKGTFIVGGENRTMDDFFFTLRKLSQRKRKLFHVPRWAMLALATLKDLITKMQGKKAQSLISVVDRITLDHPIDISKIQSELGYRPTPLDKGIRMTIDWLSEHKPGK